MCLAHCGCQDRALLVLGSNTAKQAVLTALLDPSTHFQPPLTHSHHQPTGQPQPFQSLSNPHPQPFQALLYVCFSRFRRFFSRRFSTKCWRGSRSGEARGHISASFHLQRSNEGPSESFCQGAHNRTITPNMPKIHMGLYDPPRWKYTTSRKQTLSFKNDVQNV
jgi:hypothetical protein